MKKLLITALFIFTVLHTYCQCDTYFNFQEGAEYEMTHYSANDKISGKSLSQIISVEDNNGVLTATIKGTMLDKKGEESTSLTYEYICENGVLKIDMGKFIPKESFGNDSDIEFDMKGDYLEIPENLEVGQELKDGQIEGKIIMEDNPAMANMTMAIRIFNRKVVSKEDITTPAGTFSCYKISYDMESTTKVMGMNTKVKLGGIEYVTKGVGVIKTESYNKNGKLSGYSILSAYK